MTRQEGNEFLEALIGFQTEAMHRFDAIDLRLNALDDMPGRMAGLEQRVGGLEQRVGGIDQRLWSVERWMIRLDDRVSTNHAEVLAAIKGLRKKR